MIKDSKTTKYRFSKEEVQKALELKGEIQYTTINNNEVIIEIKEE